MKKTVFNEKNTGYLTGQYPLFLGEQLGLYDSITVKYPNIDENYILQRSLRWTEDEVNLEQSRMDMLPERSKQTEIDLMTKTLALLWELDSVASRSIVSLFAPFITNSELTAMMSEWNSMEIIHAKTYSEIIRQCIPDTTKAVEEVVKNDDVLGRSELIIGAFDELVECGAKFSLGMIQDGKELKQSILKGIVSLYLLERVQFMSSFAVIFGMAETGRFLGIAKLVQLICRDEIAHAKFSSNILEILRKDNEWLEAFNDIKPMLSDLINEVIDREMKWNSYLFSDGRTMVGLNKTLLDEWVLYCATIVANDLGVEIKYPKTSKVSITWMDNWIDFDKTQNANQEADNTSYRMNSVVNDSGDEVFEI